MGVPRRVHKGSQDGWWSVLQALRSRQAWQLTVPPSRLCLDKFSSASQVAINHPLCLNITSILRAGEDWRAGGSLLTGASPAYDLSEPACRLHNAHYTWPLAAHLVFYSLIIIQHNHRITHDISFDFCRGKQRSLMPEGPHKPKIGPTAPLTHCATAAAWAAASSGVIWADF